MRHENITFDAAPIGQISDPYQVVGQVSQLRRALVTKLVFDRLLILLFLPLIVPVLVLIAALVRMESPGAVLFRQMRHGLDGVPFRVFKFRTMYVDQGDVTGAQQALSDDARVTRMGRILRRTCLDELPQVWDVFRGKMSLVGPRPHPVAMKIDGVLMEAIYHDYADRLKLRPGMSGLSQVNGNRGPVHDVAYGRARLDYDKAYIKDWSIWMDIKILIRTVTLPFKRGCY